MLCMGGEKEKEILEQGCLGSGVYAEEEEERGRGMILGGRFRDFIISVMGFISDDLCHDS